MNILHINTSDSKKIVLGLNTDSQEKMKEIATDGKRSQLLLPEIEDFLKEENVHLKDLTEISLFVGPGSFTGLRVGATIASTLSLLLNIPINGNPPGTVPELTYENDNWGA